MKLSDFCGGSGSQAGDNIIKTTLVTTTGAYTFDTNTKLIDIFTWGCGQNGFDYNTGSGGNGAAVVWRLRYNIYYVPTIYITAAAEGSAGDTEIRKLNSSGDMFLVGLGGVSYRSLTTGEAYPTTNGGGHFRAYGGPGREHVGSSSIWAKGGDAGFYYQSASGGSGGGASWGWGGNGANGGFSGTDPGPDPIQYHGAETGKGGGGGGGSARTNSRGGKGAGGGMYIIEYSY